MGIRYDYVVESVFPIENKYYGYNLIANDGTISCENTFYQAKAVDSLLKAQELLEEAKKNYTHNKFIIKRLPYHTACFRVYAQSELEEIANYFITVCGCLNRVVNRQSTLRESRITIKYLDRTEYHKIFEVCHSFYQKLRNIYYGNSSLLPVQYNILPEENNTLTIVIYNRSGYVYKAVNLQKLLYHDIPVIIYKNISTKELNFEQYKPIVENTKEETTQDSSINSTAKRKRMYNLPKYVCYDKAESRNRERNVFQIQLKVNNKLIKNNLYTVKDAVVYVASKMLEHTDIWSLEEIANYLKTYNPEMENGNFIPSNTPKSPCWRKREKKKNIQTIKEQINSKLSEILKFAKDNDININVDIN